MYKITCPNHIKMETVCRMYYHASWAEVMKIKKSNEDTGGGAAP